jgi:hypothetical protein
MRSGFQAVLFSSALILGSSVASAQSALCDAVKELIATKNLRTLATGQLVDLGAEGDAIQMRGPGKSILPRTKDCKVHHTSYKSSPGSDLSYYCELTDADPRGRDHKRIMRDLNSRLRPCMAGWSEREDFNESKSSPLAWLDTYAVEYTKDGRKISIIRLTSLDDTSSFSTTINVTDKLGK